MGNSQSSTMTTPNTWGSSNRLSKQLAPPYSSSNPTITTHYRRRSSASPNKRSRKKSFNDWSDYPNTYSPHEVSPRNLDAVMTTPFPALSYGEDQDRGREISAWDQEGDRSRVAAKMTSIRRRISRSMSRHGSRQLSISHHRGPTPADEVSADEIEGGQGTRDTQGVFGLGLHNAEDSPPSGIRRFISASRRPFNIPGIATRYARGSSSPQPSQDEYNCRCGAVSRQSLPRSQTATAKYNGMGYPAHRATSQDELEYTHLGGLKFGSLRVVNGNVSPAPSNRKQMSCPDLLEAALQKAYEETSSSEMGDTRRDHGTILGHDLTENQAYDDAATFLRSRPESSSWFLEASPRRLSLADCEHVGYSRPTSPLSFERVPSLMETKDIDDESFEDEGVEISSPGGYTTSPVDCPDDGSRNVKTENTDKQETQDTTPKTERNNAYSLNKTDSGYSTTSHRSAKKQSRNSRQESKVEGHATPILDETSPALHRTPSIVSNSSVSPVLDSKPGPYNFLNCNRGISETSDLSTQIENVIGIKAHGSKEFKEKVLFPWPHERLDSYEEQEYCSTEPPRCVSASPEYTDAYGYITREPSKHAPRSETPMPGKEQPRSYSLNSRTAPPITYPVRQHTSNTTPPPSRGRGTNSPVSRTRSMVNLQQPHSNNSTSNYTVIWSDGKSPQYPEPPKKPQNKLRRNPPKAGSHSHSHSNSHSLPLSTLSPIIDTFQDYETKPVSTTSVNSAVPIGRAQPSPKTPMSNTPVPVDHRTRKLSKHRPNRRLLSVDEKTVLA